MRSVVSFAFRLDGAAQGSTTVCPGNDIWLPALATSGGKASEGWWFLTMNHVGQQGRMHGHGQEKTAVSAVLQEDVRCSMTEHVMQ